MTNHESEWLDLIIWLDMSEQPQKCMETQRTGRNVALEGAFSIHSWSAKWAWLCGESSHLRAISGIFSGDKKQKRKAKDNCSVLLRWKLGPPREETLRERLKTSSAQCDPIGLSGKCTKQVDAPVSRWHRRNWIQTAHGTSFEGPGMRCNREYVLSYSYYNTPRTVGALIMLVLVLLLPVVMCCAVLSWIDGGGQVDGGDDEDESRCLGRSEFLDLIFTALWVCRICND